MAVNLDLLIKIFLDMKQDVAYFIDRKTGDILQLSPTSNTPSQLQAIKAKIDSGAVLQLPRYSSKENYSDMEAFIPTLKDIKLQKRLRDALDSGGAAFKFFRDALTSHNLEKEKWSEFRYQRLKAYATSFLKNNGIS